MTKITKAIVRDLQPGKIVWDSEVTGFAVRAQGARKTFLLKTRSKRRDVWLTVGEAGTFTVAMAREQAAAWKRELRAGVEADTLRSSARGQPTVNDLADRYLEQHIEAHLKPSTQATFKRLLRVHIRAAWGRRLVTDVSSDDVAKLHHRLRDTPRQANQTIAVASKMFTLAEVWKLRPQNSNPCLHLRKFKEVVRTRFYDDNELRAIGRAIADLEAAGEILPGCAAAIRLATLTGCRRGELLDLLWTDVDFDARLLDIRDAKAGPRRHRIGAAALAFLASLARVGPWVCQGHVPDRRLSETLLQIAWGTVRTKAGLKDARLHDVRHSYGTFAGATGANAFLIKDALGHATLAMSQRYVNVDADPMTQLVDRVADRVAAAMSGADAEIVPIPGRKRR